MKSPRVAVVYDASLRPDTTGGYCLRALQQLATAEHFSPERLADLPADAGLYLCVDDGLDYPFPRHLRPALVDPLNKRTTTQYNALNQVEAEVDALGKITSYTYDANGNRETVTDPLGKVTTFVYDDRDRVSAQVNPADERTTYTYDANGNTSVINAAGSLTTNTWDIENRNTKIQLPGAVVNTFTYDGDGSRRRIEDSAGLRNLIWDTQNIVAELDNANSTVAAYTLAPQGYGSLISQRRSGATSFHHYDALGSTDRLTDSSQAAVISYLYRGFGQQTVLSGSAPNPFTWLGRMGYYRQDDAGNYWVRARTYQPTIGRFTSLDPVRVRVNLYVYVSNRPLVFLDPSGREGMACAWIENESDEYEPSYRGHWCCNCSDDQADIRRCIIHPWQDDPVMTSGAPIGNDEGLRIVESFNVKCADRFTEECSADFRVGHIQPGKSGMIHWFGEPRTAKGKTGTIYPDRWGGMHCVVPCSTWNPYRGGTGKPPTPCAGTKHTSFTRRVCLDVAAFNQDTAAAQQDLPYADDIWGQCCIRVGHNKLTSIRVPGFEAFHVYSESQSQLDSELQLWETQAGKHGVRLTHRSNALVMYANRIVRVPPPPLRTTGLSDWGRRVVINRRDEVSNTLAHETGHLLQLGHEFGGALDSQNLMNADAGVPQTHLTLSQCARARDANYLRAGPFGLSGRGPIITSREQC